MTIVEIGKDDEELVEICKTYGFEPEQCASALRLDPLGAAGPFPGDLAAGHCAAETAPLILPSLMQRVVGLDFGLG